VRFRTARFNNGEIYDTLWQVGPPESAQSKRIYQQLPPDSFQEIDLPAGLLDEDGKLTIEVANPPANGTDLLFDDDGMEVLYPESTFAVNFARGLAIIFCWLALLATIGLAAGSLLSFPVAAFFSVAVLGMGLSSGTLASAVDAGTVTGNMTPGVAPSIVDRTIVPVFKGLLTVIRLVEGFSPIDSLSSGRSITWLQLGSAFAQIVLLLGGIFVVLGITFFTRRELAAVQANS
jgi:hypothetical protein